MLASKCIAERFFRPVKLSSFPLHLEYFLEVAISPDRNILIFIRRLFVCFLCFMRLGCGLCWCGFALEFEVVILDRANRPLTLDRSIASFLPL